MWTSRNWGASLMPGPADVLGPILEMMTWVGFVPGIPLLVAGYVMAKNRCLWISTTAEVFRWSDGKNTPHLSVRPPGKPEDWSQTVKLCCITTHATRPGGASALSGTITPS
ncbi:MAG: hypothetical protein JWO49_2201 [Arthrobacter sp.]|nr:hypothetical protein [Arthrobacter sp.]